VGDYRLKITVRNARILKAIEEAGYKTQAEFARASGIDAVSLNAIVAMRQPPVGKLGHFSDPAKLLMEALGCGPEELWTEDQLFIRLKKNSYQQDVDTGMAKQLMGQSEGGELLLMDMNSKVAETLESALTGREAEVIRLKFYEEKSQTEIASIFGVTHSRIGQIEQKAIRKLRHPKYSKLLEDFMEKAPIRADRRTQ
jgi:transcriptional regulator with XRE-family HTH domain